MATPTRKEQVKDLTYRIRKGADEDKLKYVISNLEEGLTLKEIWQGTKQEKRQVIPFFTKHNKYTWQHSST